MKGNERHSALSEVFRKEGKRMTAFADRYFSGSEEVNGEDIVQDVFLHLFDMTDLSIPVEALSAYIYRSLRNRITDFFRKKRMATVSSSEEFDIVSLIEDERSQVEDLFLISIETEILYEALGYLDEMEQKLIIETEFENRPFKEIAAETDTAVGTLLSKKSRAVKKLKKILMKEFEYEF